MTTPVRATSGGGPADPGPWSPWSRGALLSLTPINRPVLATEGASIDNGIVFSFTDDTDPSATAGDFKATIDWGDGTPTTAGAVVADAAGGFDVTGSHTYAAVGSYPVKVAVVDLLDGDSLPTAFQAGHPTQETLVSDVPTITADNHDPNLVNPWGIAFDAGGTVGVNDSFAEGGPFWVADNGTGFSSLYDGAGVPQPLAVATPALPTGVIFNPTSDFRINKLPTPFLFADQQGQIAGWTWTPVRTRPALVAATAAAANYTGLAMASDGLGHNFLYAARFDVSRSIDVFDASFDHVGSFIDPTQKDLPAPYNQYEPYNIQDIGGDLYVTYAQPNASGPDAVPGSGFVDVSRPRGS